MAVRNRWFIAVCSQDIDVCNLIEKFMNMFKGTLTYWTYQHPDSKKIMVYYYHYEQLH